MRTGRVQGHTHGSQRHYDETTEAQIGRGSNVGVRRIGSETLAGLLVWHRPESEGEIRPQFPANPIEGLAGFGKTQRYAPAAASTLDVPQERWWHFRCGSAICHGVRAAASTAEAF